MASGTLAWLQSISAHAARLSSITEQISALEGQADEMHDQGLHDLYKANAAQLGRVVLAADEATAVVGSTDMGNVSYSVPAIHPMIKAAPDGCAIHTKDFAGHAASPLADLAVLDGAKAMAMTVVDFWLEPAVRHATKAAFDQPVPVS